MSRLPGRAPALALALALVSALLLAPPARAAEPDIPRMSAERAGARFIRTDGAFVVWSEEYQPSRFQRYASLYGASLADRQPFELGRELPFGDYIGPLTPGFDVGGGVAVWVGRADSDAGARGIMAQDLATGARWALTEARAALPATDGARAAWWEDLGWGGQEPQQPARLVLRDLRGGQPQTVATIPPTRDYLVRSLRLSGGWAAWMQGSYDNGIESPPCWSAVALRVGSGAPQTLGSLGCESTAPLSVALSGAQLAYTDAAGMLTVRDLERGVESKSGPHENRGQSWAGRFLFWLSLPSGTAWGYDPASDSAFPLPDGPVEAPPAAGGGVVAWFAPSEGQQFTVRTRRVDELLPTGRRAPEGAAGRTYFQETGHTLGGAFRDFWLASGGLSTFGYPLTEEFVQRMPGAAAGYTVQYLERQRFELHPENAGTPYLVQLGRLGAEALAASGRDWQSFPKADPSAPHYVAQTGQAIAPEFWDYWRSHGLELGDRGVSEREALALWGYPISPPQQETLEGGVVRTVQWFERARFEYHPGNPAPYRVLLGRLAAEQVDRLGWR